MSTPTIRHGLSRRTALFQLLSLLTILSIILSCRFLSGGGLSTSRNIEIPQNLSLGGMEQVEQEMRNTVREPAREALGADADEMFRQADEAYKLVYQRISSGLGGQSMRAPGLSQMEAFGLTFGLLAGFQDQAVTSKEPSVQIKDKLPFNDNVSVEFNISFNRSNSKITGEVEITVSIKGDNNKSLVEKAKGKYEVDVCPDPQGNVLVTYDLNMDTSGSGDGKSLGMQMSLTGSGNGYVNEDAALTGLDLDMTSGLSGQKADASTGNQIKGAYAEVNTRVSYSNMENIKDLKEGSTNVKVNRTSSEATQQLVDETFRIGSKLGFMFTYLTLLQAEKQWQNGFCVEIVLNGAQDGNPVKPESKTSFTATVHHKFEGTDIDAPITGTLSGEKSLTPQEKTPSPVNYIYEAPKENDKQATVTLETRSKRGAAKKEITFNTVQLAFTVSGRLDQMSFSGTICDPYKPFVVNASGGGATAKLDFTPNGESLEGSFTFSGGGSGFTLSGQGTYRINAGSGGGTLDMDRSGCVDIGACNSKLESLALTPLDDPSACGG